VWVRTPRDEDEQLVSRPGRIHYKDKAHQKSEASSPDLMYGTQSRCFLLHSEPLLNQVLRSCKAEIPRGLNLVPVVCRPRTTVYPKYSGLML
jgi:hypothetical protein